MKKRRFTESQIVAILKELDVGTSAAQLSRKHASMRTRSACGASYAGLGSSDLVRLKQLEEECQRKDRVISRLTLEVDAMKDARRKLS